jgi:hypothetical protein
MFSFIVSFLYLVEGISDIQKTVDAPDNYS